MSKKTKRAANSRKQAPPQRSFDELVRLVDQIADHHGITHASVGRFPDLLEPYGLQAEQITPAVTSAALNYHRREMERLRARVKAINERRGFGVGETQPKALKGAKARPTQATGSQNPAPPKPAKNSNGLFGYPVTAVLRWMGANGWSVTDAATALANLNIEVALATIRCQVAAGKKGQRGEPAAISPAQAQELNRALKGTKGTKERKS